MPDLPENHLADWYDKHAGCPAVLFGKGPSLDKWDLPKLPGEVWMTINEACCAVPAADYHIMNDFAVYENLQNRRWKPSTGVVVTKGTDCRKAQVGAIWPNQSLFYFRDDARIFKSTATGGGAVQILAALGIKDLLMVGFDAMTDPCGPEYAQSVGSMPYRAGKGAPTEPRWRKVNNHVREMLERCQVTPTWWHSDMDGVRASRASAAIPLVKPPV